MSKNNKCANLKNNGDIAKQSSDNKKCNLKFSSCDDNSYQLWNLDKIQLKKFVTFAKKIENATWIEIKQSKGFHYETLYDMTLPSFLSRDITLKSLRVDGEFRIYGYRNDENFYMIWFDSNHELT